MTVNSTWTSPVAAGALDLATGGTITEAIWDGVISNLQHLGGSAGKALARVYHSTTQSVANDTSTQLTFDTEDFDDYGFHDPANANRFLVPAGYDGIYHIRGTAGFAADADGVRILSLKVGATTVASSSQTNASASIPSVLEVSCTIELSATNQVSLWAYHTAGASLNVTNSGPAYPALEIVKR